jgi:hypothetical protein
MTDPEHPAVTAARRALKLKKGLPTDADRPVRRSQPPKVIRGQMTIFEAIRLGEEERNRR